MNFEERKNVPQNARISAVQEFRAKRKNSQGRKNFYWKARNLSKTQEFSLKRKDFDGSNNS